MAKRKWSRTDTFYEKRCRVPLPVIVMGILVLIVVLITVPAVLLRSTPLPHGEEDRLECPGIKDEGSCEQKGCRWSPATAAPSCHMPKGSFGYKVVSDRNPTPKGFSLHLENKTSHSIFGPSIQKVLFEVTYVTSNIVRFKLSDDTTSRYEVPVQKVFPLLSAPTGPISTLMYEVVVGDNKEDFNFRIRRHTNGTVLWDTRIGSPILTNQFLQIATYLPSKNVYGFGENTHEKFRHNLDYQSWPLFSRDQFPLDGHLNLYGVHPFYTCLEEDGKSHGVLFLNSNAMEYTFLPHPALSVRTIGGILDFFVFVGDNPEHVVQLYTSLVGRPIMPPYWSLGFQLSRYGYKDLNDVKTVVERTRRASIPQDVQYVDIDHMERRRDFTWDKEAFGGLDDYIKETKQNYSLRWVIILDPAIEANVSSYDVYNEGNSQKVFIKKPKEMDASHFPDGMGKTSDAMFGKVWPDGVVAFPDFFLQQAKAWWKKRIVEYYQSINFDGLWIDMNEPANFGTNSELADYCPKGSTPENCWSLKCPKGNLDDPPYRPLAASIHGENSRLSDKTICMAAIQGEKEEFVHYDVHNLYGWSQSQITLQAAEEATKERSIVISRSTYVSSGQFCGHWLGDNHSRWPDLHRSIIGMLEFNLFGIPYIGADICGFFGDTSDEMCKRWMQLGAFYPFFRNHNAMGQKDQDPAALGADAVKASRAAVLRRYTLLPYLYTLFYKAHINGNTVIRPLFHEFPKDNNTWAIDTQFFWGSSLLISPVLNEGQKTLQFYLPNDVWYKFKYEKSTEDHSGRFVTESDLEEIPVHVRGGSILPTQEAGLPTKESIKSNFTLYVFPKKNEAEGELFWDDGISIGTVEKKEYFFIRFIYTSCQLFLKFENKPSKQQEMPPLREVVVFRARTATKVLIDGVEKGKPKLDKTYKTLTITVNQPISDIQKIHWEDDEQLCQMHD